MIKKKISLLVALAATLCFHQQAQASGVALIEQSVSGMGTAYAGSAAIAEDASTIFFNPAGITYLCDEAVCGHHLIVPYAKFRNRVSILTPTLPAGANPGAASPMRGDNGGNAGEPAVIPHLYVSKRVNNCLSVGLGVNTPYGLSTEYCDTWVGRYHATKSDLYTLDINPVAAYKVCPQLSIGGGIRAMYLHARIANAVDYGTIAWLQTSTLTPAAAAATRAGLIAAGFQPETQDGIVELRGNSWGWGGNVGILYEPCCGTRLGFNYRSQVKHQLSGSEKFGRLPPFIANPASSGGLAGFFTALAAATATDTRAHSKVTLPDTFSWSVYHELNPCWAIMGDLTWTRWKLIKRLVFTFDNTLQPNGVTTLRWKNSLRYSLGVTYRPNCSLVYRLGLAYDETPVPNRFVRTPRVPDEDRFWTAFGIGYDYNSCLHLDFGYAHLFARLPRIDKAQFTLAEDATRGGLQGKYAPYTDIISCQVVWSF